MVRAAYEYQGPVYIRLGRSAVPVFHEEEGYTFQIGKGEELTQGSDVAVIANGLMVERALRAGEELAREGISARIIDMPTIKPLDEALVLKAARECGRIVTCEEHSVIGGLGEAVCSFLSRVCPTPVSRVGWRTCSAAPAPPTRCWSGTASPPATSPGRPGPCAGSEPPFSVMIP